MVKSIFNDVFTVWMTYTVCPLKVHLEEIVILPQAYEYNRLYCSNTVIDIVPKVSAFFCFRVWHGELFYCLILLKLAKSLAIWKSFKPQNKKHANFDNFKTVLVISKKAIHDLSSFLNTIKLCSVISLLLNMPKVSSLSFCPVRDDSVHHNMQARATSQPQ